MDGLLGLTLLAEGPSSADRGVDIIAIHGLGGYGSWQHESSLWLRDFLPVDLPSARIFTYSYRCSAFCDSWTIFDGARKLLEKLKNLQADNAEASRPLIFICHSLGGLVLKCALTEAFQNRGHEALDEIITATQGIIFLGTPYSTSSSELYTNISRITAANEATEVTMVAARAMRQIVIGFMNLPWASLPWSIASFYEAQNLPGTDLRDMCRFTSNHDGSYVKVLQALRDIIHSSSGSITDQVTLSPTLSPAEHEVLKSLEFEDASARVPKASRGTCEWILEHDTFNSWLDGPSRLLWIRGNAGSGKSVLMKHVLNHVQQERADCSSSVASFFFSHHGANQSVTSLLRSLLYQLLKSVASSRTFEIFSRLTEIGEVLGSDRSWDDDVLTDSLLRLVDKSTALGDSLSFFIDALDECDDPDRVVSLFRRLSSFGPARGIRACLSSRQSPHFTPVAEIRMEEHNFIDIQTYLNDKLVALRTRSASTLDVRQVSEAMAEKSRGGFVWAALVASKLIHDACLEPIEAAHVSGTETAQDALLLVLYAQRPLSTLELWSALAVAGDGLDALVPTSKLKGSSWARSEDFQGRQGAISLDSNAQLMVLCGGLLEVSPRPPKSADSITSASQPTVQFIHQTVQEFLLGRGSCALWPEIYYRGRSLSQDPKSLETHKGRTRKAQSHFRVARICFLCISETRLVSHPSISKSAVSSAHFLRYSVSFGMQHLSLAGRLGVKPETEDMWSPWFQKGFIDQWTDIHNHLLGGQNTFKPHETKAAHVMSYYGIPWHETALWGGSLADINKEDHRGQTPLSLAAAMGYYDICEYLIVLHADVGHRDHVYGQTPLGLAAAHGHRDVVQLLLDAGSDLDDHTSGVSPLWLAARSGHSRVVELLLEKHADARTANSRTGETALSRAAALGHAPIVSLLLDSGAQVESWDKRGWTPLHHAVSRGRKRTLEMLLRTLGQGQLHRLKMSLGNAKNSWINAVLTAIILGLGFQQCGESHKPQSGDPQGPKTSAATAQTQSSAPSVRKRGRHKPDSETDEDDCEEEDKGIPGKRPRRAHPSGRRFACPYYRRNAAKYSSGACNGKGFENIYRLKSHLKDHHSRAKDWQRCHICQVQFRHEEIKGHKPCVERQEPTDYEDGFDIVQSNLLTSKDMFPSKSSEEACWYGIFKVLFPDWPDAKDIPSPYQDNQNKAVLSDFVRAFEHVRGVLTSSDTITEIKRSLEHDGGEQGIRGIFERALDPLDRACRLLAMTETECSRRRPPADASQPMSPIHPPGPTPNLPPYTPPSQQEPTPLNMGRYGIQTDQTPHELMGTHSDVHRYQEFPDQSPFQTNSASHNYNSLLNPPHYAMSISDGNSSFVYAGYDMLDMPTEHTAYSGCNLTGSGQLGVMDGSGSLPPFDTQMTGSVPRHAQPAGHLGHESGAAFPMGNQSTNPSYVGGSVPSGSQQPPRAASMVFRESDPRGGG
ncbi:hypothetical protein ACJZ2D_004469 [Fusarium nematophilum]